MKEFLLVFRREIDINEPQPSPEQMQAMMKTWQDWIGGIAAQNRLVSPGNRLSPDGRVLKSDKVITNGPFVEIKEAIGGYTMVKANSMDEAVALAQGCPILAVNGSVEIRLVEEM